MCVRVCYIFADHTFKYVIDYTEYTIYRCLWSHCIDWWGISSEQSEVKTDERTHECELMS